MKRKFNREGFYDAKKKVWKSFYTAPSGRVRVTRHDSYNDLKADIKKNISYSLKRDITTKKASPGTAERVKNTKNIQDSIHRDIKKIQANNMSRDGFRELEKKILTSNYKTDLLNRIPRDITPDQKSFLTDKYDLSYTNYKYKKPFYIGSDSFDKMKYNIKSKPLKPFSKYQLEIGTGLNKITGIMSRCDFKNQDKFETKLKTLVKEDPGLPARRFEKMTITIKGIKF